MNNCATTIMIFLLIVSVFLQPGCQSDDSMGVDELIKRGQSWYRKGEYDRAIADYDKVLSINPKESAAYFYRGVAHLKKEDYEPALLDLNKSIELDPENAEAYSYRGAVWSKKADYDKAIENFNRAIDLNPENALYHFERGAEWENKKEDNLALIDYNKAIMLDGDFDSAYFFRGMLFERKGQLENAISDYTKAIELYPEDSWYYFKRGFAREKTRDYDDAISDYRVSIKIDPTNVRSYNNLSWIYSTCKDQRYRNGAEAVKLAEKAVKLKREAYNLDTLAAAYAEAGRFNEAIKTQETVIELLKKYDELGIISKAEERLKSYSAKKAWRE